MKGGLDVINVYPRWYIIGIEDLRSKEWTTRERNYGRRHCEGGTEGEAQPEKSFLFSTFWTWKKWIMMATERYLYASFWGRRLFIIRQQRQNDALRCWEIPSKSKIGREGRAYRGVELQGENHWNPIASPQRTSLNCWNYQESIPRKKRKG